ncbi:endonuclease/exonuclease/phosphatase family protein [Streptomyces axinellae]|uniref:Endonuclease/exonuclease/phosphatase family protein n=2 Tax=Streptomyces axinellae TaxID=552788 RepID=A0ABN3Q2H8_9ACTN
MSIRTGLRRSAAVALAVSCVAAPAAAGDGSETEPGRAPATTLRVMSFNVWLGGSMVDRALDKQVAVIRKHKADVVGLQETDAHTARDIGRRLHWHYYQSGHDLGIVSRYPMKVTGTTRAAVGVGLRLPHGRAAELWNAHLWYQDYGPYGACFTKETTRQLVAREERRRAPEAREIVKKLGAKLARTHRKPLLLVGDFNAPSHLDWTRATRRPHCGRGPVPWPTTRVLQDAGFRDSFRQAHPAPRKTPGLTWSPIVKKHQGEEGPKGAPEPQDRVDFVHYKGSRLKVVSSTTIVEGRPRPEPHQRGNIWPSDHKAVLTTFRVQ